jgi:hypothetical protein
MAATRISSRETGKREMARTLTPALTAAEWLKISAIVVCYELRIEDDPAAAHLVPMVNRTRLALIQAVNAARSTQEEAI